MKIKQYQGRTQDFIWGVGGEGGGESQPKKVSRSIFFWCPPTPKKGCLPPRRQKKEGKLGQRRSTQKIYKEETYHFTSKRCPHTGESEETSEALEEKCC